LSKLIFEEEYLPNAFARDVLAANERSFEQRLSACRMIASVDDTTPTVLGQLVIGKQPRDWLQGAYIQFVKLRGVDLSCEIEDELEIDGTLSQVLRRIDEKIESHNRTAVEIGGSPTETRTSPYPRIAIQQIVRNAVMHRAYEATNAPVRVYWFSDRIEIINPGGPFGAVTTENFGQPGITDYRNPNLAEAIKVLGFVQRFGVGISTARSELARNGNPAPKFSPSSTHVLVTLYA
jgi:ATP-dependent DNA helicase RecG